MTAWIVALLVGAAAGWYARDRKAGPAGGLATRDVASPALLPEPALRWLLRAHGAVGVWLSEADLDGEGPSNERVIDAERLDVAQVVALDRRMERARDDGAPGVEQVDAGTFVVRARDGMAAGLLLPAAPAVDRIAEVEEDLDRLLEGLKRRPAIVALAQASADALAIESPGSVALRLAYQLERVLDAPVVVASRTGEQVIVAGVSGRADRRLVDRALPGDAPLAAVARGEAAGGRLDGAPLGAALEDRRTAPEAVLLLPIEAARERVGAVALWLPGGAEPIGARLAEIHECVRDAAPRLRSALAHHAERSKATTDRLTGLANRDVLERAMNREGGAAAGVLIALDIDHFKRLNDTLGHPAGDAALVHVARLLKGQVRASDVAARVGGEEFMLWLPNAPLAVGEQIAERIRARLADAVWEWRGSAWPLTASFGVAGAPDSSRSAANLPELADRALYQAKHEGRNRVVVTR